MTVTEVLQNLDRTIDGKELMLKSINDTTYGKIMRQFLEINIDELKKIRADLAKITLQAE